MPSFDRNVNPDQKSYIGSELELFAAATRWKSYFARSLGEWISGDVLEVGAGMGSNTRFLHRPRMRSWCCLEPDEALAAKARDAVSALGCSVRVGTTMSEAPGRYDTVLYIDVLEHIEDDRAELERAVSLLRPGGHVIVLAPAHQALYSEFDRAVGHFRRYDASSLTAAGAPGSTLVRVFYLDSVGMLASLANRTLLKSAQPSPAQIGTWDRILVPMSRLLDPCLGRRLGKSVVAVWRR